MGAYEDIQKSGGRLGKAIDTVGNFFGNILPDWNISESLESWGGNLGSDFVLVPKANATEQQPQNDGGLIGPLPNPNLQPKPTPTATTVKNNPVVNTGTSFNDIYNTMYPGWDRTAAEQDWIAKGKPMPGYSGSNAYDEVARREAETRNAINSGYDQYLLGLQGMQDQFGNSRQESLDSASKIYEQIFGGLGEQKQTNLDKLEAGKQEVQSRQASSIKDLQENLSNVLRGATMQFGAMGAGDTSATRTMLPYAYTKLAGQQEGNIRNQANNQLFEIEQQGRDTELKFSEMWRQTEVDKESQLQGIRDYYGNAIQNVQTAMANAPLQKAQALASLNQSLLQEAMTNLRNLEATDRQAKENLKTWATNRMSELNNLKLQLSGSANFNPQDILWKELSVQGVNPGQNGQGMDFSNYVTATRKKYLGE